MIASAVKATPDGQVIHSVWSVPVLGKPVLLRDDAMAPSVSPNGSFIAFTRGRAFDYPFSTAALEIWLMGPNGEDARKLVSGGGKTLFGSIKWSPDSSRIAFMGFHRESKGSRLPEIETIALKGGTQDVILPDFLGSEFCWIPDGRIIHARQEVRQTIGTRISGN